MRQYICIFGSRDVNIQEAREHIFNFVASTSEDTVIIEGEAQGVDIEARRAANFYRRELKRFPADWKTHGKAAGFIRNTEMEKISSSGFCIYNGISTGSKHTINLFKRSKKHLVIIRVKTSAGKYIF